MSSSHFSNSHNVLYDNTFITASNYHAYGDGRSRSSEKESFDLLRENISAEAIHNSHERCDAPKLHPETRKAVQQEILGWITQGNDDAEPKKILWVSGPAGAGKTAIAGSIAEICEEQGLLAGSFFFSSFSGSEERRSKRWVVATLVYSLLRHSGLQHLRGYILSIIERDPAIFQTSLRNQCTALLLTPFHYALGHPAISVLPKVIILDGLDEVEAVENRRLDKHKARLANEADQLEILAVLLQAAQDVTFPFRIIVVSRPERVISDFFTTKANHVSRELFLDEKYDPNSDITLFLNASFADIRRRYGMAPAWPEEYHIKRLVDTASGQFIYAATVIRFLQNGEHPNPRALLQIVLDTASQDTPLNPLAPLDALYSRILMSSSDPPLAVQWIGAISEVEHTSGDRPARFVRHLLQQFEGQGEYLLENLTSLVRIPPAGDNEAPYGFYHKSLEDYLHSKRRCGRDFQRSFKAGSTFLWDCFFDILKTKFPAVPLVGSEWQDFIQKFFDLLGDFRFGDEHPRAFELATCDVGGWLRTVVAAFINAPNRASSILARTFRGVHKDCTYDDESCSQACRHWRSGIIGECKRLGWSVPTPSILLGERMAVESGEQWNLQQDFEPPVNRSQSSLPPLGDAQEELVRQKAYRNDYEVQHAIILLIYEALPTDWLNEFEGALSGGMSTKIGIRQQMRRIEPAVRVQMQGLDAWLHDWS